MAVTAVRTAMLRNYSLIMLFVLACSTASGRQCIPWPPRQHCQQTWFTRSWRIPASLMMSEVRHHPPGGYVYHADMSCVGKPLLSQFEAPDMLPSQLLAHGAFVSGVQV